MSTETGDSEHEESGESEAYSRSRVYRWFDDRLDLDDTFLGKAFPEDAYASFLLGEVTLFSFAILVLTGTFLGLLYNPSTAPVEYTGQVAQFAGKEVPAAFASVLRITYDVRFGMTVRMVHHWASYLFVAAMSLHMMRVFFTGAYRNPRELNWMVGSALLFLGLIEGFLGYALPFDEYSSTATGIGFQLAGAIPYVGSQVKYILFGGPWPGGAAQVIPRMFFLHVFLIPLVLGGLIAAHMFLLVRQKHTEQEADRDPNVDGDDESFVVGTPLFPNQVVVTAVVLLVTLGTLFLLAGFFPVQRLPVWGPNNPTSTPANVAPDWYFVWVFGMLKLVPNVPFSATISSVLGGVSLSEFLGGVFLPTVTAVVLALWPFVDYSHEQVHFTADPIERPLPTAVGVGAVVFVLMLSIGAMNGTVAVLANGFLGWLSGVHPVFADFATWWVGTDGVATGDVKRPLQVLIVGLPLVDAVIVYVLLSRRQDRKHSGDPSETTAGSAVSQDD